MSPTYRTDEQIEGYLNGLRIVIHEWEGNVYAPNDPDYDGIFYRSELHDSTDRIVWYSTKWTRLREAARDEALAKAGQR